MPAPAMGLTVRMSADSIAAECSPHCSSAATALNPHHATRYPVAKNATDADRLRFAAREAPMREKSKITGAAEGSIIATIITAHITNSGSSSFQVQLWSAGAAIVIPFICIPPIDPCIEGEPTSHVHAAATVNTIAASATASGRRTILSTAPERKRSLGVFSPVKGLTSPGVQL